MRDRLFLSALAVLSAVWLSAQSPQPGQPARPARDTPAQAGTPPPPTGKIAGRVLAADNGRPVRRARAFVSASQFEGRGTLTDDNGAFELSDLPAARYTLTVSKTGFVTLSYGQRRPLQAGTPLQLAEGQQLTGIEFRLPRGSVIAGHVYDETGEPMPGASVRVMRYQYAQGERQLTPAGNAQTDDQGAFRVWDLNPGEYYVNAVARNFTFGARGAGPASGGRGGPGGGGAGFGGGRGGARGGGAGGRGTPPAALLDISDDETAKAYAPTYFPGVGAINEAQPVTVGVSQQLLDVNFNLLLVRTAHVTGTVKSGDGSITYSGQVNLAAEGGGGRGNQLGITYNSRIDWEGHFSIANVPPGRYILRARGTDTDPPIFASQPLTVASGDLTEVDVTLYPGATISGNVVFEGTDGPELSQVRINAPSAEGESGLGPNPNARVAKDGTFTLDGVSAGAHWIRSAGPLRGWSMKSVIVDGRDMVDTPIELRSRQQLNNVSIVFTNKQTEINGTVTDGRGQPITDYTVLAFASDPIFWRPLSRQIATARPDQTGKFQIRGLPPGIYYLVTVDPAEQGEWFEPAFLEEHRIAAARVTLGDGDIKTQDFRIGTR